MLEYHFIIRQSTKVAYVRTFTDYFNPANIGRVIFIMAQVEAQLKMVSLMWTYRKMRGLTIKQASEMMGLKSPAQWSKWESGFVKPDFDSIKKILWVLQAKYEEVFGIHGQDLPAQNIL